MAKLFGRTCTLTLGTTQLKLAKAVVGGQAPSIDTQAGIALTFKVKKNLKPEPNSVEIKVWNLSPATRKSIEQPKLVPVQLDVGYGGDNHTVYLGQLRSAESIVDGPNIITTISSGDSEQAFGPQRALFKVPAQATPQQILQLAGQAMGVGTGNLAQAQALASASTGGPARTFHGVAATVMGKVVRSNGLEWSVQDGALQLLQTGQSIGTAATAVLLSAQTGMIGSPSSDNKGIVTVKALIQPGLLPGLPIVIAGALLQGAYRIEDAEFNGATWGPDWTVTLHCRKWK